MTDVELEIVAYLKQNREGYCARKEIARRARSREEFEENPQWVAAPLSSLVNQGIVEQNDQGHYKLSDKYDA